MTIRTFKILAIAAALIASSIELVVAQVLPGLLEAAQDRSGIGLGRSSHRESERRRRLKQRVLTHCSIGLRLSSPVLTFGQRH